MSETFVITAPDNVDDVLTPIFCESSLELVINDYTVLEITGTQHYLEKGKPFNSDRGTLTSLGNETALEYGQIIAFIKIRKYHHLLILRNILR